MYVQSVARESNAWLLQLRMQRFDIAPRATQLAHNTLIFMGNLP